MVPSASRYALAYLCWVITVAFAFLALVVSRTSIMLTLGATGWDRYAVHALNQFGFLFMAIVGLGVIVFTEHFYRTGVEKQRLFARFLLITTLELLFLTLLHLAGLISEIVLGIFATASLFIVIGEGVLALVLYGVYRRISRQPANPRS